MPLHAEMPDVFYNELLSICEARRSCRKFQPFPVDPADVQRMLKIASTSPFASGRKNWEVLVVEDLRVRDAMALAVSEQSELMAREMDSELSKIFLQYAANFQFFRDAPLLFVPVFRVAPTMRALLREQVTPEILLWERDNAVQSISCVAMLLLLAAQTLGLGACYMTGPLLAHHRLASVLQLPPERRIGAIIPVGRPLV